MRETVVYALYIWIVVSVAALVFQLFRRWRYNRRMTATSVPPHRLQPATSEPDLLAQAERAAAPLAPEKRPSPSVSGATPATNTPTIINLTDEPVLDHPADTTHSEGRPTTVSHRTTAPGTDLARLLNGISLPCNLSPIAPDTHPATDNTVYLVTHSDPPEVVGPAVADELERLGYTLEPAGSSVLIASRGSETLTLTMVLEPRGLERDGVVLFPRAAAADVMVTIAAGVVSPAQR